MKTPTINSIIRNLTEPEFSKVARSSCTALLPLATIFGVGLHTTCNNYFNHNHKCVSEFQTLELIPKRNRFGTNQPKNPIDAKNVLKISVTSSNLDTLGCCRSCRCDPFRQWQNRNTIWHTGVTPVEYVKTFAWNDQLRWGSWSVEDFGEFWCFLTKYYRYFNSCKLHVECRQCKRIIGHFPLHDNFRLFRRVQDWVVNLVRFS